MIILFQRHFSDMTKKKWAERQIRALLVVVVLRGKKRMWKKPPPRRQKTAEFSRDWGRRRRSRFGRDETLYKK
uniref:Uncharacterized protein n=1 Tax=Lepeophtheirus salmonis TaxID=72036 RepID=A0A0K2VCY6_LEPSM